MKKFTLEHAQKIAAALDADDFCTVAAACYLAGVSPNTVKQAIHRARRDQSSEEEFSKCALVELAVERQCQRMAKRAEDLAADGKRTGWHEFLIEARAPTTWGRKQSIEVSGPEGGPVRYETMSPQQLRAEAERLLGGVPALVLEAPKEEDPDV